VRESCDRHGALLIFDEIPSCLGRSGTMFVTEQTGVVPDMLVIGKGLGGGVFPLAALIARADLDVLQDRAIGHYTHEKSSVGCAAALATIAVVEEKGLVSKAATLGGEALAVLNQKLIGHPGVRAVRGMGLYFGIEVESAERADAILYRCLERGLSFKIGGGTVITLCPPLTVTEDELYRAFDIVMDGFSASSVTASS
jgi:4-aminobutyrate aminotransferase